MISMTNLYTTGKFHGNWKKKYFRHFTSAAPILIKLMFVTADLAIASSSNVHQTLY
jgi:hypothetical protein